MAWTRSCIKKMFSRMPKTCVRAAQASCLSLHLVCSACLPCCFDFSHHRTVQTVDFFSWQPHIQVWFYTVTLVVTCNYWDSVGYRQGFLVNWQHSSPSSTWGLQLEDKHHCFRVSSCISSLKLKIKTKKPYETLQTLSICSWSTASVPTLVLWSLGGNGCPTCFHMMPLGPLEYT